MMSRLTIAVGAAALCLLHTGALAQFPPVTDPNKDEVKCQRGAGKAGVKQVATRSKCVAKCIKTARAASGPYTGCFSPFADPATNTCILDPAKGADAKARATIVKACAVDCPECYTAQDPMLCSTGDPFTADVAAQSNPFGGLVFCTEAGAGTPSAAEAKCEDGTAKALVKLVAARSKCYTSCNSNLIKGKIAPGSCTPPVPTDTATVACIFDPVKGADAKATIAIDKVCEVSVNPANAKPACYGALTGSGWVSLVAVNLDARVPIVGCGAPSPAFLD
jgi:hypothetical protein